MTKKRFAPSEICPCGSGHLATQCCLPLLQGNVFALTAEQLMRSRYTAYTLLDEDYLLRTWHSSTRPTSLTLHNNPVKWLGLTVLATELGSANDTEGSVTFIARYKVQGRAQQMRERSRFVREDGQWCYLNGGIDTPPCIAKNLA
jgi:SEC-C motif domain protein